MKPLMIKELREHRRLALGMMVAVALAMVVSLHRLTMHGGFRTITSGSFVTITGFGFSACAFALGVAQSLFERRDGCLGFLVHRPIGRHQIFLAKVLSGAAMYLGITLLPLLTASAWVALRVPAPFFARYLGPPLLEMLAGFTWYFAAIMLVMRPTRVSRILPLGLPALSTAVAVSAKSPVFGLLIVAALVVSYVAASASFRTLADPSTESTGLDRAALALSLWPGLLVAGALVVAFAPSGLLSAHVDHAFVRAPRYQLQMNGDVIVERPEGPAIVSYTDLQGAPVVPRTSRALVHEVWSKGSSLATRSAPSFAHPEQAVERLFDERLGQERWYHACGRVLGYDARTARLIGSFGPDGFSAGIGCGGSTFVSMAFEGTSRRALFVSPNALFAVDVEARTVVPLISAPLRAVSVLDRERVVVVTDREAIFLAGDSILARAPVDLRERIAVVADTTFTVWSTPEHGPATVVERELDGTIVRTQLLPELPLPLQPAPIRGVREVDLVMPFVGPTLVAALGVFDDHFRGWVIPTLDLRWLALGAVFSALATFAVARFLRARSTLAWTTAALLIGPAAPFLLAFVEPRRRTLAPTPPTPNGREICV